MHLQCCCTLQRVLHQLFRDSFPPVSFCSRLSSANSTDTSAAFLLYTHSAPISSSISSLYTPFTPEVLQTIIYASANIFNSTNSITVHLPLELILTVLSIFGHHEHFQACVNCPLIAKLVLTTLSGYGFDSVLVELASEVALQMVRTQRLIYHRDIVGGIGNLER